MYSALYKHYIYIVLISPNMIIPQSRTGWQASVTPIFQLFFCEAVWQLLVRETNRYADPTLSAESANSQCTCIPTDVPEMMAFVALLISMGIVNKRPSYAMSRCEVLRSPLYPSTVSRNRFMAIFRFLHLAENTADDSPRDKLSKVRPLLDIVVPLLFRSIYKPGRNLSLDETVITFSGRLGFKQ